MPTPVSDLELAYVDVRATTTHDELRDVVSKARDEHWLTRTPLGYMITRHDDVAALLRDRRWHSAAGLIREMNGLAAQPDRPESILSAEGDVHSRLRRLVAPAFSPKAADRLRPFMRSVVNDLVDSIAARGRGELVADVCEPYPIPIICELLGAPKSDWRLFSRWATDLLRIFNNNVVEDLPLIEKASEELGAYVEVLIADRRTTPADDLITDLIAAEEQGDRLSTEELKVMVQAVIVGGTDTTRNQLACSVALFCDYPEQWTMLADRPDLAAGAVEESMRVIGAVRGTARYAAEDVVLNDVLFPRGTLMFPSLVAANFDSGCFDEPNRFDITRPVVGQHLTFGSGIHYCLGASLARAELQEALPILAQRMPGLALDGEVVWKPISSGIWGPELLPIRWDA